MTHLGCETGGHVCVAENHHAIGSYSPFPRLGHLAIAAGLSGQVNNHGACRSIGEQAGPVSEIRYASYMQLPALADKSTVTEPAGACMYMRVLECWHACSC